MSMHLSARHSRSLLYEEAQTLMGRLLGPLCGVNQMIGLSNRARTEARIYVLGAELTGVHLLLNKPPPKSNSYHIGGAGVYIEEALIRALGETVERYCQMISHVSGRHATRFDSYNGMVARGDHLLSEEKLSFFTAEQFRRPRFPFSAFDPDMPIEWVRAQSLTHDREVWIPAQIAFVGYGIKVDQGERRLYSSVTTGTAAHTDPLQAARSAILELIQLDSAMGFWFSECAAREITLDRRTNALRELICHHFHPAAPMPRFFWLKNADLPAFSIACLLSGGGDAVPASAVGLGSDFDLEISMYKALLEAIAVSHLAKISVLNEFNPQSSEQRMPTTSEDGFFDLDANVAFYARSENQQTVMAKFPQGAATSLASDLPPDGEGDTLFQIRHMTHSFKNSGKELFYIDMTTPDVRELGFVVLRVWSPDVLSLSLPSYPPGCHGRFRAYGGFRDVRPHPFP